MFIKRGLNNPFYLALVCSSFIDFKIMLYWVLLLHIIRTENFNLKMPAVSSLLLLRDF